MHSRALTRGNGTTQVPYEVIRTVQVPRVQYVDKVVDRPVTQVSLAGSKKCDVFHVARCDALTCVWSAAVTCSVQNTV